MLKEKVQRRPGPAGAFFSTRRALWGWLALTAVVWGGCSERLPPPAKAGRQVLLSAEELERIIEREAKVRGPLPAGFGRTLLTNTVRRILFLEDARRRGYPEKDEVVAELKEERRRLLTRAALERAVGTVKARAGREDIRKYRSVLGFRIIWIVAPWSFDRDLRRKGEERLRACLAELRSGRDFSEVADRWSDDSANFRGGYLGMFGQSELPAGIRQALAGLRPGEMSRVTEVSDGFMIVRLDRSVPTVGGPRYEISGILFRTESVGRDEARRRAEELRRRLGEHPERFREWADTYSDDSRNRNGGWQRPSLYGQLPPAVAETVWRTRPGRVSAPVETPYGWFVVRTESVMPPSREAVRRMLKDRTGSRELKAGIRERKEAAERDRRLERYRRRLMRSAESVWDYSVFTNGESAGLPAEISAMVVLRLLRENVSFTYGDVLAAMERAAPRRPRTYAERVAFFETAMVFPELVHADGQRRGLLARGAWKRRWMETEEEVLLRHYVRDLVPALPEEAELRRWFGEHAPAGLRGRRFEEVRSEVAAAWRRWAEETAVRRRFAELVAERKVVLCDLCVSTRRERAVARLRAEAERSLGRGETNAAVRMLARACALAPSWDCVARLAAIPGRGRDEALRLMRRGGPWLREGFGAVLDDPRLRDAGLALCVEGGWKEAVPEVERRLRGADPSVRLPFIRALVALAGTESADTVWGAILAARGEAESEGFLAESLAEFAKVAGEEERREVVRWLRRGERSAVVRAGLLRVLASGTDEATRRFVQGYLADPDARVREAAREVAGMREGVAP